MPIPEDRLYKPERLNRWFAVSSILMTGSIAWMTVIDHYRPWREFQDRFFVGKAALAHLTYLDATRQDRMEEIEEAGRRIADARELVQQASGPRRAQLGSELTRVVLEFSKAEGAWSRTKQVLDVTRDTYEKVLGAHGSEHAQTNTARNRVSDEEEVVDRFRGEKERWEDEKARIEAELKRIDEPVRSAEKRLAALQEAAESALKTDQDYRGVLSDEGLLGGLPIVGAIINAPFIDFSAPKTAPGRQQVKQLVLPDVRQQLNYLETYTTDRCTTCHIAIDDPEFSKDQLARKLERSLPGINEALQRLGHQPFEFPTPPELAAGDQALAVGRVTEHWGELTESQQEAYFDDLLTLVNKYLSLSGRKTIDLGQPILAHPDLDLFLSVNSPHPMARMGCTVCHEGNPQETDFVQAAHTPPTHEARERWEEEYYITLLGVPNVTFETIEHYWDRPSRWRGPPPPPP